MLGWKTQRSPKFFGAISLVRVMLCGRLVIVFHIEHHFSDAAEHARPRLGAVSFQHRFGSALNQHVHLHACVTDGVFKQRAADGGVTFHAGRPLTASDLIAVNQRVRLRLVRRFRRQGFLSREAAADMLAWQRSGFSVDASVRISLADRDVPGYLQSLEHLLRYCARPAFALDILSVVPGTGRALRRPAAAS